MPVISDLPYYDYLLLPLLIFFARMTDTSLATLRIVMISKGKRRETRIIGFIEVLVWLVAVGQIMKNLNNVMCYLAWAGGFTAGSYIGFIIENKLAIGRQLLRIITNGFPEALLNQFRQLNHGFTVIDGQGAVGPVKVIELVVERQHLPTVLPLIQEYLPNAFTTTSDVVQTNSGVFTERKKSLRIPGLFFPLSEKR
jgi:uncharacterized protein YebE (UPF0316 family)